MISLIMAIYQMTQSQTPSPTFLSLLRVCAYNKDKTFLSIILHCSVSLCCYIFFLTEDGFGKSHAKNLLSPEKVDALIELPTGCLEQTMTKLVPTASAIRYLDLSSQWVKLPPGKRDEALDYLERGRHRLFPQQR